MLAEAEEQPGQIGDTLDAHSACAKASRRRPLMSSSVCASTSAKEKSPTMHELAQAESGVSAGHESEKVILGHDDRLLVVGGKLVRRGISLEACHVIGLEVLPRVQGLVGWLPGVVDGGQQVRPVLFVRGAVAMENLLHVHRGPRGRLEVRELLALHLLIPKCPNKFGSKVPGPEVSTKPSHFANLRRRRLSSPIP